MGHRQHSHFGRSADDDRERAGRDYQSDPDPSRDLGARLNEARQIADLVDKNERETGRRKPRERGK